MIQSSSGSTNVINNSCKWLSVLDPYFVPEQSISKLGLYLIIPSRDDLFLLRRLSGMGILKLAAIERPFTILS